VAEPIKISKPSKEQERALSLKGSGWRLVWDPQSKNWKTVKVNEVKSADITYDDWRNGQTTYTPITPGRGGALDVAEQTAIRETEQDPLYKYVRDFALEVVTDEQNGNTYLRGIPKGGTTAVPFYLYLDSKGTINLSQDYNAIKKKTLDDLKATGKLDALFQELYNKKKISKETFNSRNIQSTDFNAALVDAINIYSRGVIGNRQFDPTATTAPDFLTFLQSGAGLRGPAGGGDENLPRREFQDISKIELNNFIDAIYLETIGRKPSEEQRKAKLKELNAIVKKGIVTTTSVVGGEIQTRRKGGFDEQQQALRLKEELKTQNPLEYERRQAFEFMDELQKIMSGGM
jgi:hypothetical protein